MPDAGAQAVALPPAASRGAEAPDLDALWAEFAGLVAGGDPRPDFRFDLDHYRTLYGDAPEDPDAARAQWRRSGDGDRRYANRYARTRSRMPDVDAVIASLVTEPRLSALIARGVPGAAELAFEIIALGDGPDAAVSSFSHAHYLATYPDVQRAGADPLDHYFRHGRAEGRLTLAGLRSRHHPGARPFDPYRPTVLVVTHELSRTGAPIVALDLVREAGERANVLVVALREGPLLDEFRGASCEVLISPAPLDEVPYLDSPAWAAVSLAVVNSIEAYGAARLLVARDIPFAVYVHEYPYYSFPLHKTVSTAACADLLVFSSAQVRDAWRPQLADVEFDVERDSLVVPQRPLRFRRPAPARVAQGRARLGRVLGRDLGDARIVCGAGAWQWRKGTDLFVSAAQIARGLDPSAVFVWIGDGLVREDLSFGVWMGVHLDRAGADAPGSNLHTLPAGELYRDLLIAADAMFLSSRLDPLPNVVFDAVEAGCRVVAFEGASGFSDQEYGSSGLVETVEYANPAAAAQALLALPRKGTAASPPPPRAAAPDPGPVFDRIARALRSRVEGRRREVIGAPEGFRSLLFGEGEAEAHRRRREAERVLRLGRRIAWRDEDDAREALAASGHWVHAACRVVPATPLAGEPPPFGLHWHAHYLDDLEADLGRPLVRAAWRRLLTTDTDAKAAAIRDMAAAHGLEAEVRVVPNRGRDVLPFLDLFAPGGPGAEVGLWAHVHQKRSLGHAASGDRWRRFLLGQILGDAGGPAPSGPALLAGEGVGLVAPFDPHFVPWHASRALLPLVEPRLPGPLPSNPLLFPVGNMFWARSEVAVAMRDLWGPDRPWPNEPIANDGTVFHLIERLWPAVAAAQGLASVFVSDPARRAER